MHHSPYAPPEASVSVKEENAQSFAQRALIFLLGAAAFTVVFWSLWFLLLRPVLNPPSASASDSRDQAATTAQDELLRKYQQQAKDADDIQRDLRRQVDVSMQLQKRQSDLLTKQEEQARRFDAVLRRWEAQAAVRPRSDER